MSGADDGALRGRRARSFGTVADEYERGRPGYAAEAIRWLLGEQPLHVLDLGAGTGKLTAALLAAGHDVTAVEPLEPMRERLAARLPAALALEGSAEALPLRDSSVDAVLVGSAFHWFDREPALREIARVLRGPQILGLLGNSFDTSAPWVAAVRAILGPPALERPGHWPSPQSMSQMFEQVEDRSFGHSQRVDLATLRDLATSRSSFAILDPAQRESELARLDELWAHDRELAGRAEAVLPWLTRVRRCATLR